MLDTGANAVCLIALCIYSLTRPYAIVFWIFLIVFYRIADSNDYKRMNNDGYMKIIETSDFVVFKRKS